MKGKECKNVVTKGEKWVNGEGCQVSEGTEEDCFKPCSKRDS